MPYVEYDEVEAACTECGRLFRSEEALASHREEAHAPGAGKAEPASPRKAIRCTVCHQTLPSLSALQRHSRQAHTS